MSWRDDRKKLTHFITRKLEGRKKRSKRKKIIKVKSKEEKLQRKLRNEAAKAKKLETIVHQLEKSGCPQRKTIEGIKTITAIKIRGSYQLIAPTINRAVRARTCGRHNSTFSKNPGRAKNSSLIH